MHYKRTEYFRYTFGEPLAAKFRIAVAGDCEHASSSGECSLIDLSPGGARLKTKFDIPDSKESTKLHITFTLYETQIDVQGTIVWKKQYGNAQLFGITFEEDLENEQLIINELKLLSKAELEKRKIN